MHELDVPGVRQATGYTCGPAALLAALLALDIETSEEEIAELADTTEKGTRPGPLASAACGLGAVARAREMATFGELRGALARGQIPIVALQAWAADDPAGYGARWTAGHYAVVLSAHELEGVRLMDPAIGEPVELSTEDFLSRWHDAHDGDLHHGLALFVRAPSPPARRLPLPARSMG